MCQRLIIHITTLDVPPVSWVNPMPMLLIFHYLYITVELGSVRHSIHTLPSLYFLTPRSLLEAKFESIILLRLLNIEKKKHSSCVHRINKFMVFNRVSTVASTKARTTTVSFNTQYPMFSLVPGTQ